MSGPDLDDVRRAARELGGARVPRHEAVPLARARGRVLGVEVRAGSHLPVADSAAADGWAVRGPGPWRVVGGEAGLRRPGEAVEVAAGEVLPRGAVAVVASGAVRVEAGLLHAPDPDAGAAVRARGQEAAAGDVVLARGAVLTPARLGVAAAAGADTVHVVLAPRAVLLVTGDELVDTGAARPGRVRDSLGHVLPPLLQDLGTDLRRTARSGDDVATLRDVFAGPYRAAVDLVVTTGGTGGGRPDHVRDALREVGARSVVDGTAVRPGATAVLAVVPDGPVVLALPGDPLAAVAALVTLLPPWLDGWLGRPGSPLVDVGVPSGHESREGHWVPDGPRGGTRLRPARLVPGRAEPVPVGADGDGMLRGLGDADGFLAVGPDGRGRWLPLP